ncbi:hypothetical protein PDR5_36810 [Pseudomonas sp. DR 5-09]|nr:hypothetical protein PDR5_36810 [Pseudomonas sp. DR 5-09]
MVNNKRVSMAALAVIVDSGPSVVFYRRKTRRVYRMPQPDGAQP